MSNADPGLATPYRSHTCGELRASDAGSDARLAGWVHRRRDMGHLIFLDLRDRYGITQVVVDAETAGEAHAVASTLRSEDVVAVDGAVAERLAGTENAKLATGSIELRARAIEILSRAKQTPFPINDLNAAIEERLRLRYRYLDLRREPMRDRLVLRSKLLRAISQVHHAHGFVEVETPLLIKSTPEGARDFIVPSRQQPGNVYALPQSPQQLKQLLMVAGMDRYFQIAHCMRDEDSRAVVPERKIRQVPFPRFTYREALDRFGSDKPDVRYGLELHDLGELAVGSGFRVFDETLEAGGRIVALAAPGMAGASRSEIDGLVELARKSGAKGLVHLAVEADGSVRSPILKFLGDERAARLAAAAGASNGDLVLIVADRDVHAQEALGKVRVEIADRLGLVTDASELSYVCVHRFPMYQWDEENKRWDATHNPFSGVVPEDEELLVTASGDPLRPSPEDPAGRARALQHDLALNGWELGGGSIRIHRRDLLERSFALMGLTVESMQEKFGALLEAFDYGAPPHGGIALGIDRWMARLTDQENIREVTAFPKTGTGSDLMLGAPSPPDPGQLADLGLKFVGLPERRT